MAFKSKERAAEYNKEYKAKWYKENKQRLIDQVAERNEKSESGWMI